MGKSILGGRGVTGIHYSGKIQDRVPAEKSRSMSKSKSGTMSLPGTAMRVSTSRYRTEYKPGDYAAYRNVTVANKTPAASKYISLPGTSKKVLASSFSTKYKPGDYGMYRRTLVGYVGAMKGKKKDAPAVAAKAAKAVPAASAVVRNVVTEKLTPVKATSKAQPARTTQSAFSRQRANAMNRTNQPAGPMGGGRGGGFGGGGGRSGGSLSGQGGGGRQTGTSRTGGTRGNEPAGPKRG